MTPPGAQPIGVGDWFALGCVFFPTGVRLSEAGDPVFGLRFLTLVDVASQYVMHHEPVQRVPDALQAADVLGFLGRAMKKHGMPHVGIIISHSAWLSSSELAFDEDTRVQGDFLQKQGIEFSPMTYAAKAQIEESLKRIGLRCVFNADNIAE